MLYHPQKLLKTIFVLLFFILMPSSLWALSIKPISYTEALNMALSHNPGLQGTKASIDAAQGNMTQAQSQYWPQLSLEFNGARSNNPMSVFGYKLSQGNASFADFGAAQFTGPSSLYVKPNALNHPGYYSNLDTALKLTLPIYTGGKIQAHNANARALLMAAQHGNQQAKNELAYQLFESYEGVLAANQLIEVTKAHIRQAKLFLKTTQALKTLSITLESDELIAKNYLHYALLALSNVRLQQKNQLDHFRTLLGAPQGPWVPRQTTRLVQNEKKIHQWVQQAFHHNPALHAAESQIKAEKANIQAAQSAYKPQVNLQLRQDWNGETLGSGLASNMVSLGANWTLFSAGERQGNIQQAVANAKKAQFELDSQRNQLKLKIHQLKRHEAQFQYEYQLSLGISKEEIHIINSLQKRFEKGLVPLGAILESQMKLTQSKAEVIQAKYNLQLTQANLLMLTNQLIPNSKI